MQGYGPTGAALARSAVDTILFIGSVNNGRRVVEASAERVIPVVMELGGKDAFIVCDDADLEQAVHSSLAGCYINCGQNCVASERILVYDAIYDAFEKRAAELVREFRQGSSREGLVDVALGSAGFAPIDDRRGGVDRAGRELQVTATATADQLTAAAGMLMPKDSGVPAVWVTGVPVLGDGCIRDTLRRPDEDLFR